MSWVLLLAAVAPVVFMLHFVYVRDRYERESLARVLLVFFVSFLTVIPAALVESLLLVDALAGTGLIGIAIASWGVIAASEEFFKYIAIKWLAVRHPSFNEVYDGIVYSVAASLGFATIENILYVFMSAAEGGGAGFWVAVLRALFAVPGHALWGVMMGYYIGLAKFESDTNKKRQLVCRGVLTAIFWHGLYDFFAFSTEAVEPGPALLLALGVIAVVVVNWVIAMNMIRRAQQMSAFKHPRPLEVIAAAVRPGLRYCHRCGTRQSRKHDRCVNCGYRFPH